MTAHTMIHAAGENAGYATAEAEFAETVAAARRECETAIRRQASAMDDGVDRVVLEGTAVAIDEAARVRRSYKWRVADLCFHLAALTVFPFAFALLAVIPAARMDLPGAAILAVGAAAFLAVLTFMIRDQRKNLADIWRAVRTGVSGGQIATVRAEAGKGFGFGSKGLHVCDGFGKARTVHYDAVGEIREDTGGGQTGHGRRRAVVLDRAGRPAFWLQDVSAEITDLLRDRVARSSTPTAG